MIIILGEYIKEYNIVIKDPRVQRWFNYLFGNADLSMTIEDLAIWHLKFADKLLQNFDKN